MLLKKSLCAMIVLTLLLLFPSLATESSEITNIIPSYTVSQEFIDFASPIFLSPNLGHKVIDNETLTDVTADFLADTEKYYSKNDWTSIHYYLAQNGYTIIRCDNSSVQPYSTEVVKQVSGWPILAVQSDDSIPDQYKIYYNVEAKISGSFAYNPNTGKIVSVTQATYSNFRFYPVLTSADADVSVLGLAPFSSFSNYVAQFGCTFRLPYTFNKDALTHYLIDSQTNSSLLRLAVDGCPE